MLDNLQKFFAAISFLLLTLGLIAAHNSPVSGYELDIYSSTPALVWIAVFAGVFIGALIILVQVFTSGYENSNLWLLGLASMLSSRLLLLYFPYIRGYLSWRGDNIAYLGFIRDILSGGHFSTNNIYPVTLTYLTGATNITGLPDMTVANFSTAIVSVLSVLFTYLLAGALTKNKRIQILATLVAAGVMLGAGYNVILAPNGWSIMFMPLLLYLYLKQDILHYRFLLVILLVAYPFFHPLSALIIIMMLTVIEVTKPIFRRHLREEVNFDMGFSQGTFLTYVIIEFAIFGMWMLSHSDYHLNLNIFWDQILHGINTGKFDELNANLGKLNIGGAGFFSLLFKLYGSDIVLVLLMAVSAPLLLLKRFRNTEINRVTLSTILCVVVLCGFMYLAYLLGLPGTSVVAGGQWDRRILSYVDILIPVFTVLALNYLFEHRPSLDYFFYLYSERMQLFRRNGYAFSFTATLVLLIVASVLGIRSLYSSPFTSQPNGQITSTDLTGTEWLLSNLDWYMGIDYVASPPENFSMAFIGFTESYGRSGLGRNTNVVPDNFGYEDGQLLGAQYTDNRYLMITEYDRVAYTSVWEDVDRFTEDDFRNIENDPSVVRLYDNNGMEIYQIYAVDTASDLSQVE